MDSYTWLPLDEPGGELLSAMAFLAALAYPESSAKRDRAIEAMKVLMLRAARQRGITVQPWSMRNRNVDGTLRRLDGRIEKRLEAAEAASVFSLGLREAGQETRIGPREQQRTRSWLRSIGARIATSADDARRNGGALVATHRQVPCRPISVNAWARMGREITGRFEIGPLNLDLHFKRPRVRGDWERDTWRTSRPVLHLACALRSLHLKRHDPRGFGVFTLLANPQWIREVLQSAEQHLLSLELSEHPALKQFRHCGRVRLMADAQGVQISPPGRR